MSAHERTRTSIAIAFALAMIALGALNPHGALGEFSCGLSCSGAVEAGAR